MFARFQQGYLFGRRLDTTIDSSCTLDTSTHETYYSNFIAKQLDAQKYLKYIQEDSILAAWTHNNYFGIQCTSRPNTLI